MISFHLHDSASKIFSRRYVFLRKKSSSRNIILIFQCSDESIWTPCRIKTDGAFAQCGVLSPSAHRRARRCRPCVHVAMMPRNTAQGNVSVGVSTSTRRALCRDFAPRVVWNVLGRARSSWRATQATPPATRAHGHWDYVCREACHTHRGQLQLHRKQGQEFDFELHLRLAQGGVKWLRGCNCQQRWRFGDFPNPAARFSYHRYQHVFFHSGDLAVSCISGTG